MDKITSDSILESLRKRSEAKLDGQRSKINGIARDVIKYSEAIVALVSVTGEMHIDLKEHRVIKEIISKLYDDDKELWSRLFITENTGDFTVAQGNARITRKPDSNEETVTIICTYRFDRNILAPQLLNEVAEVAKDIHPHYGMFELIDVYGDSLRDRHDDKPKWTIDIEARDSSIVVTLK